MWGVILKVSFLRICGSKVKWDNFLLKVVTTPSLSILVSCSHHGLTYIAFVNHGNVFIIVGFESQHQTSLQPGHRATIYALPPSREVQETTLLFDVLPLCITRETQVPHARLEHSIWFQRFWFWGKGSGACFVIKNKGELICIFFQISSVSFRAPIVSATYIALMHFIPRFRRIYWVFTWMSMKIHHGTRSSTSSQESTMVVTLQTIGIGVCWWRISTTSSVMTQLLCLSLSTFRILEYLKPSFNSSEELSLVHI